MGKINTYNSKCGSIVMLYIIWRRKHNVGRRCRKIGNDLVIRHQFSKVAIPIPDIINVTSDDTYAGKDKHEIRIGSPYGTTERIAIHT